MKTNRLFFLISVMVLLCVSCRPSYLSKSPEKMRELTVRSIPANSDLVFKSILSLLHAESYVVNNVDNEKGIVTATRRIQKRNYHYNTHNSQMPNYVQISKVDFNIKELSLNLTEVRITLYEGVEASKERFTEQYYMDESMSMVYSSAIYKAWFKNLMVEIEKREELNR